MPARILLRAVAVLYAIDHCERTTVYGFGVAEPTVPVRCAADSGARGAEARACAVGLACDKYYPRRGEPAELEARARHCQKARAGQIERIDVHAGVHGHVADYFKETALYHDVVQEWLWLAKLAKTGAIVWRGQPGPERVVYGDGRGGKMTMEPR